MGKIKLLIIYLITVVSIFSEDGYIASFNTLRLGRNKKDYTYVAQILENFDLIGLIEVMNEEGVEELVDNLEKVSKDDWDYHISPYPVGKNSYKEHFAFVWKKDKVTFLKERGYYEDTDKSFSRQPYGADFKVGNFDFTFVLAHSIFGKSESLRRAEAFKLNKVYDYFQSLDKTENDIVLAGDFNLSAFDEAFEKLLLYKDKVTYVLNPTINTTLGKNSLANSYDNMFISKNYTQEFNEKSGALDFTNNNFKEMKEKVSDHLPIFIVVETEKDDD